MWWGAPRTRDLVLMLAKAVYADMRTPLRFPIFVAGAFAAGWLLRGLR